MTDFNKILTWFQLNYQKLVQDMKNCTHHYNSEKLNPFHLEGDVWTHTLLVVQQALLISKSNNVHLAALFHDLGKLYTRHSNDERERVSFSMHENVSAFKVIDILNHLAKDMPSYNFDFNRVCSLINWHSEFHKIGYMENNEYFLKQDEVDRLNKKFGKDIDLYVELIELFQADNRGRFNLNTVEDFQFNQKKVDFLNSFLPTDLYSNKEHMPKFYMLCGVPASGKTTLIQKLLKSNPNIVILSSDDMISKMYPNLTYNQAYEKVISKNLFGTIEDDLKKTLQKSVLEHKDIIFDRTNLVQNIRNKWLSYVPDKYYQKIAYLFLIGEKTIYERNEYRAKQGKTIPQSAYDRMVKQFIFPSLVEFDDIRYVSENSYELFKDLSTNVRKDEISKILSK